MKLIERIRPDKPVRNNAFKLTERGKALRPTLEELGRWAYAHLKEYNNEMLSIDSE
jgi:DNA-binding HxlR family transcriptional regulator